MAKTEFDKPDGGYYLTPAQHAERRKKERAKTLEAAYKISKKGKAAAEKARRAKEQADAKEQGLKDSQTGRGRRGKVK